MPELFLALGNGFLPTKYCYLDEGADDWHALRQSERYELGHRELTALTTALQRVSVAPSPRTVIHVGIGDGCELEAIASRFADREYVGVDISRAMLEHTLDQKFITLHRLRARLFECDVESGDGLEALKELIGTAPRTYLILNQGVLSCNGRFLSLLAETLGPDDDALFTFEGYDAGRKEEVLSTYNLPEVHALIARGLHLGRDEDGVFLPARFNEEQSRAELWYKTPQHELLCLASYKPKSKEAVRTRFEFHGLTTEVEEHQGGIYSALCQGRAAQEFRSIVVASSTRQTSIGRTQILELIAKSGEEELGISELEHLCNARAHVDLLEEALARRFRKKGGEVRYIAPSFQSNICHDNCRYCGWSNERRIKRIMLVPDEFGVQIDFLKRPGYGVLEISNGTQPRMLEWRTLRPYLEEARSRLDSSLGEGIGICSAALEPEVFEKIFPEYAAFWVQWMETYDVHAYADAHPRSSFPDTLQGHEKSRFIRRLGTYRTVLELGGQVMLGVQYGISPDPVKDALVTIEHARVLHRSTGAQPLGFGTAINNPVAACASYSRSIRHDFSLDEYRTLLAAYKFAMPQMGRWFTTRVPLELTLNAIVDGDYFTGECSEMVPGKREGLVQLTNQQAGQFSVFENQKERWERDFGRRGLRVDYAWLKPRSNKRT